MAVDNDQSLASPPPDPRKAITVDELLSQLVMTHAWAGKPSMRFLAARVSDLRGRRVAAMPNEWYRRVNHQTIHHLFRARGRSRLDYDLVFDLLIVMGLSPAYQAWWQEAWATVFRGQRQSGQADYSKLISAVMGYGSTS